MNAQKTIFDSIALSNENSIWGAVTAETLYRIGLKYAVVSPGSRSTPLTFALARHENIETIPALDERSASFFALGLAKQTGLPTVLICTSGTAAANFYPAIIEAKMSHVPLLVLTADRPAELRECHAGQTIDQIKIYGDYPIWQKELALPSSDLEQLRYLRQTLVHAWQRCLNPIAGVVHLNFPFREPLSPETIEDAETNSKSVTSKILIPTNFFDSIRPHLPIEIIPNKKYIKSNWSDVLHKISKTEKGLIIVGPNCPYNVENFADSIKTLSAKTGWPVLADGISQMRCHISDNFRPISHYELILRNKETKNKLSPEVVIQIGPLPTSKFLRNWLKLLDCPVYILNSNFDNLDPLHQDTIDLVINIEEFVDDLSQTENKANDFEIQWRNLDRTFSDEIKNKFEFDDSLSEEKVAWTLSKYLPKNSSLFVASSMAVRNIETYWQSSDSAVKMYYNRGANGIDGTLSTAMGIAHGNQSKSFLLTGDLALLHDVNGFLNQQYFKGNLTIILINNNGGRIFETLDVANFKETFEKYFATPQNISFKKLADVYDLEYCKLENIIELQEILIKEAVSGIRLIEIECGKNLVPS